MHDLKPIAAIKHKHGPDVDPALEALVAKCRRLGISMVGCLQVQLPDPGSCCPISHLEDLASGTQTRITQPLGSGSTGCRLDPGALANAAEALMRQMNGGAEVLILNRFGRGESEGRGFRPVIERALELGIPVLTAVKERYTPEWETFSDDLATYLPAEPEALLAWLLPQIQSRSLPPTPELVAK